MNSNPRLGIYVPEWQTASGRLTAVSGEWNILTVHADLAAAAAPMPIIRVDLAAVLEWLRTFGARARVMHLRHANEAMDCEAAAIDGLLRTAVLEYPNLVVRSVRLDGGDVTTAIAKETSLDASGFQQTLWRNGERFERIWQEAESRLDDGTDTLVIDGTVLITGGLGGVGRRMAEHLATRPGMRLALVGRSALNADAKAWIENLPAKAVYFRADVADRHATAQLIADVEQQLGPIAGVVHAAGHLEDAWIANADPAALTRVLAKVHGALNLDAALTDHASLRWFLMCSSLAGTLGHVGQGAYAAANAWIDHVVEAREHLRAQGQRFGMTRAIAWPLWAEGGMRPSPETLAALHDAGLAPLPTAAAMTAMTQSLVGAAPASAVLWGDVATAAQRLGLLPSATVRQGVRGEGDKYSVDALIAALAPLAEQLLKLPAGRVDPDRPLSAYGFDSITLTRFSAAIRDSIGGPNLAPATFLDHPTLRSLAMHLAGLMEVPVESVAVSRPAERSARSSLGAFSLLERVSARAITPVADAPKPNERNPYRDAKIAVVGIGCRFPGAENAVALWRNLCEGYRAIIRVPEERWDWRAIDGDPNASGNRTDCHFGGFIANVASFDAGLFGLSDDEARTMDPQHRLVLEAAWAMLEDAGLGPDTLNGRKVGAFVGVQRQEYQTRLAAETMTGGVNTGNSHAMLVNRLSYLFGWTGPSLAIDTGCSGSAVAIHQAVRALQSGECSHAAAGGVNVVLAPESVIVNRRMGLLTGGDTVRPFDASADGHLFADGVGLVLLRRLDDAVADGDFVYGVIAGSAANHNGEAMYLTAPSPRGQAEAMREALTRAGLTPADLDYVEGQGAANTLVDGAELNAYRQAFVGRRAAMPLGSLKGHLGHLESASGVAALIKVLMAMRSGVLPPTLGHKTLNWDAARGPAPVAVVTDRQAWPDDGDRVRRAGVHNFGYGGANVHLVVESTPIVSDPADDGAVVIVPLSAPSGPQLRALAADLAQFLKAETWRAFGFEHLRLADVAYTLQTGRRAQAERATFAVTSLTDLVVALKRFAAGDATSDPWPAGGTVDWNMHRGAGPHRRLPLPGTPFARRRFWPTTAVVTQGAVGAYYDALARSVPQLAAREEMNLLFAPLPEQPAGFSWLRTLFLPEEQPEHFRLFVDRQRAMKARLFDRIDLTRVRRVMDIGCGFATDLLQLASANPLLSGRGFTIAPAQAALAARRIDEASLGNRIEVLARDSARDDMGGPYDLMIGFEVTFHVADKVGLFGNIARNLADDGDLLLIDCVAETASDVSMPEIGQFTPTSGAFAQMLAEHGLAIVQADDASGGVANFLHDPDFEQHLETLHARLPALAERAGEHRGWANFGKALSFGLLRYVLLHLCKDARGVVALAAHNRHALAQAKPYGAPRPTLTHVVPERLVGGSVEERVAGVTATLADMTVEALPHDARFAALGITSLKGLQLVDALSRTLGMPVRMTDLFDYPSVRTLSAHLAAHVSAQAPKIAVAAMTVPAKPVATASPLEVRSNDIAIIGLAARFPGADDIQAFWRNLRDGVDSVGPLPQSRRALTGSATDHEAGFLDGVDLFDPLFFRLTPREAEAMDPQQRLFLEQCWHAIEDAGIAPSQLRGANCGVVAGVQPSEYGDLFAEQAFDSHAAQLLLGNAASILASRIAYLLDLKGPAISLDTACSSSLVAVHQAARMLRDGQADLMLAGGVSLFLSDKPFRMMERAGMLAPDGRCRPFSDRADGIAVAEGAGVVVLKRLTEALADGDRIWGVIRGSAINQDGATNGITAPSRDSQRRLAQAALKDAGLDADAIDYVEAHGTGTALGDPIEIAALSDVYGRGQAEAVSLGAVKSNIGHASAASGIAGLTKVLLSLAHDQIPATLHLDTVNPHIRLDETPFRIPRMSEPWQRTSRPRRAVVNSLGFSGTNCHVVVEEAPVRVGAAASHGPEIFLLSARTDVALRTSAVALAAYLSGDGRDLAPTSVAATLQSGREAHGRRLAIVADRLPDLVTALNTFATGSVTPANETRGTASDDALDDLIGGAAGTAFVQTLVEARDLTRLGRLWCRGVGVDWQGLRAGPRPVPVWLPPYPFERMRCWLELDTPVISSKQAVAGPSRAALLLPVWREAGVSEAGAFDGRLALVGDGGWQNLADALGAELVASETADELIGRLNSFEAIIDAGLDAALEARHELWRALAARRDSPRLLIMRPEGVAGAFAGGIAAALGGEYGALWSREMQVGGIGGIAPAALASVLRAELSDDDGLSRVLWRDGVRHRLAFDELTPLSPPAIDLTAVGQGPVLITGGLGGLGIALARHLVVRGVKVLALTGLRPLQAGDARSAAVEALRAQGATVEIYTGDLQNEAFQAFVAKLREQHGPVRGAVHAAGRVGDGARAYQSRDFAQVCAVLEPKTDGLRALRHALGDDPLVFLVSYSSISASIPSLAGGLVDYAAANAVLEAEARAAFAQGRRHERAIAWGNWTESGLGPASADKLRPLDLVGLSDAEGVALFEQALAVDAPVVLATGLRPGAATDAWSLSHGVGAATARTSTVQSAVPAALPSTTDRGAAMLSWLFAIFGRELRLPVNELDAERRFEDYGIDSILLADLVLALERELGVKLEPGLLIEHRTLRQLAAHLATLHAAPGGSGEAIPQTFVPEVVRPQAKPTHNAAPTTDRRVAVIGLACDFPGAPNAERFWENLSSGMDAITEVPADRWDIGQFYDPAGGPGRSAGKWGGFIDGIALFDPAYFGIAPEDAASLDPLVRKALEIAVQTLRGAGYTDADVKGSRTGVFVGARMSDYGARAATRRKRALTGSAQNFIAAQIAHCLDLHGPNLVVDTACSSSLTAVHLAVRSLIDGDSELALAGGVDLLLDETPYLGLTAGQALSPNGRCRTFDENADGFVPGEGAGMVLLKRLDRALADGDRVLAVIEGSAVNNDGRTMGLTTPNPEAQEQVIRQALATANADPRTVSYVEAHGTGTMIGDPIELKALWRALGDDGECGRCAVGAVKSNIGHLLSAAGIASLIKVVLMLRHRMLAPTLHCQTPNPRFAFARSPLRPVTRAEPWQDVGGVRRAGVSSFGFGGTNVHVVLSDYSVPSDAIARQPLPAQAFNRQRYWIEKAAVAPIIAAPLANPAALPLQEVAAATGRRFVTSLPPDHPILRDHVVQGVGIAPGTMHFDLVHRALAAIDGQAQAGMALRQIVFREPAAVISGAARRLDLALSPRAEGWDVEVTGGLDANIHLQAIAVRATPQFGAAISIAGLQAQAIASFDLADAYVLASKVGIQHGDFMQARGTVWEGAEFLLARLSISDVAKDAAPCFALHPALLDALCLIPFLFERHRATAETRPFIPISIGAFEVSGALPTEGWVLVRRAGAGGMVPDDVYHADIALYHIDGTPAARMTRLAAKRIRVPLSIAADKAPTVVVSTVASVALSDASEGALRDWLTRYVASVLGQPIAVDAMEVGFYDLGLDSRQLLEAVRVLERGLGDDLYPTLLFEQGSIGRLAAYLWTEHRTGVGRLLASGAGTGKAADFDSAISSPEAAVETGPTASAHTLYMAPNWSAAGIGARHGLAGQILQAGDTLSLSWPGGFTSDPKRAAGALFGWRGRQDVAELLTLASRLPGDATLVVVHGGGPEGAGLRGLLASVSRERPGLRLVSVESTDPVDLTAELVAAEPGFIAVRHRGGARETLGFAERELADASLPSGGCWLITGGLGQLGLHVGRALVSRGARVGLVGRNAPRPELAAELADLGIAWTTGDVSDRDSLQSALDTLRARIGAFTGVIHAAGVLRDGLAMTGIAEDEVTAVLAPKIVGVEHLDALTHHDPLQHFVLFSSATGSLGNIGQGVYAYANGWLDGFAATRSGPGRTLSVGWPLWAAGGMRGDAVEAARHGVVPLDTEAGLQAFGAALAGDARHVVVLHGDAARLRADLRLDVTGAESPTIHRRAARTEEPIAVIGLAGRYPGAKDLDAFWQNLARGVDAVTEVSKDRWDHAAYFDATGEAPGTSWSRWGGFVDGVDQFDPLFFHIAPREARVMDPQERLFLETAWAAMEDAAVSRETLAGRKVGVFAGVMWSQYQLYGLAAAKEGSHLLPMSFNSSVANRVSHVLDLRGPSLSLDTACSSSLTALHLAVESLRRGECDLAFAGGVNLTLHPSKYQFLGQGRMLSSDGRCRAFGEGGDGYVPGEGVGVALLKPLSQAKADGDPVWGVILASGISHGGRTAGYTVPSAGRQQELIREVLAAADIKPTDISYIEAHGTGTSLGDPIELEGLKGAFGAKSAEPWCALGSVKSNIGHLESAAGIAGLTKVLLQLRHRQLAPTLHADPLNSHLAIAGTPFRVQDRLAPWCADGQRIAGLSSFGAGGANAHLLIGEAPDEVQTARNTIAMSPELIVLSARTQTALRQRANDLLGWIEANNPLDVAALATTLQTGRSPMAARLAFVASSAEEVRAGLRACVSGQTPSLDMQAPQAEAARRFLAGASVDWDAVRSSQHSQRIGSLPTYPFERKRYWTDSWLDSAPPRAATALPTDALEAGTFRALRKHWHHAPLAAASENVRPDGLIVMAGPASRSLSALLAPDAVVPMLQGWDEGKAAAENLLSFHPDALTVIDLADLDANVHDSDELPLGRIAFLQTLIQHRSKDLRILHLTRGVAGTSTLKGSVMAGLVRMLGAEHSGVIARTMDADVALDDGAAWMRILAEELRAEDAVTEVRLRNGKRFVPVMKAEALDADVPLRCDPDAAYLITGGTSGIGLALAHTLVDAGAAKLALMGRQSLPAADDWARVIADEAIDPRLKDKLSALATLRDRGVDILVHGGALTDAAGIAAFLARVRAELGPLAGLIHAAGLIEETRPRFIDKRAENFVRVAEPKIAGLNTLLAALASERLRFVAMCSSIAAAVPAMAAGMSDYALANAYMDALVEYRAQRDDGTLWLSLQWVGWSEAGMHTRFDATVERIVRDGLGAHGLLFCENAVGASLFKRALAAGISGPVIPAPVDVERLEAALPKMLAVSRQPAMQTTASQSGPMDDAAVSTLNDEDLDRLLAAFESDETESDQDGVALEACIDLVRRVVAEVLELDLEEFGPDIPFRDVGIDSIAAVRVVQRLEESGLTITPKMLIDHPTPRALVVAFHSGMREAAE